MRDDRPDQGRIKLRLGTKLMISVVLLECLLMSAIVFVVERQMRQSIMEEFLKRGLSVSRNLAAINSNFVATYNYVKIEQNVSQVKDKNGLLYAVVSFFDGEVAAYSGHENHREEACRGDFSKAAIDIDDELVQYGDLDGERICDIAVPIFLKGEKWGTVRAGFSLVDIRTSILKTRKLLLTLGIIGLFFGYLTSVLVARRITRPIAQLVKSADLIAAGKYDHPIRIRSRDEIGYLGHRFEAMQKTLKQHIELLTGTNEQLQAEVAVRKQKEQELVAAKRAADAANIAKSNFLANISHETRTPLNGVLGMTELLLETTDLTERQHKLTNNIFRSGKALLGIINEILDFSAIETRKLKLVKSGFNLIDVIEETVEYIAISAQGKGIGFACRIDHEVPVRVEGDEKRLRQILTNILGNAVKFTERGEVVICVQVMEREGEAVALRFEVMDTGIGIEPEAQSAIFDPFSQADGSHTRQYGGTGLGLSIAKELTELMGGTIHVDSRPGKGSTFWFTARFGTQTEQVSEKSPAERQLLESLNVLVFSGDTTNCSILQYYLSHLGVTCRETDEVNRDEEISAPDGDGDEYQLVFVDVAAVGMSVRHLLETIQSNDSAKNAKIVLLSPLSFKEDENRDVLAECHGYLTKPVRQSQLRACLASLWDDTSNAMPSPANETVRRDDSGSIAGYRVLLVEDNAINMMVSREMLENLGFTVDIATNGREGVEAFGARQYDIIAMDCQMPEMDGYEATRFIREKEEAQGATSTPIPIVALTAHAMEGDRKRCLDAGMNDYLTKPFTLDQIGEILSRWLPAKNNSENTDTDHAAIFEIVDDIEEIPEESIDRSAIEALRSLQAESSHDLLSRVIEIYFKDAPKQVGILRDALSQGDASIIRTAASKLKSSSMNLGAVRLSGLCGEMETAAKVESIDNGSMVLAKIEEEYQSVREALKLELGAAGGASRN